MGFRDLFGALFVSRMPTNPAQLPSRGDAWYNATTGLGVSSYDQTVDTSFLLGTDLTSRPTLIRRLLRKNAICRKVVNKQVERAWSTGVAYKATGQDGQNLRDELDEELSRLQVEAKIKKARSYGRAFGGAVLLMSIDDGLSPSQPVDLSRVRRLLYLRPIDRHDIGSVEVDTSGGVRDGDPEFYNIQLSGMNRIRVHHSRVCRFEGLDVDRRTRANLGGWTDSVLQTCYEDIQRYGSGMQSLSSQLQSATQTIYTIKGLHEQILAGNRQFVQDWIASVELCRSNLRAVILDADGEKMEFASRPLGDSVKVAQELQYTVAAACDMPVVELFGTPPAGLSSDDASARTRFNDRVESEEQQGEQGQALKRVLQIITAQSLVPSIFGARVVFEWPSLYSPTTAERADINNKRANTLATLVSSGIATVDEVRSAAADVGGYTVDEGVTQQRVAGDQVSYTPPKSVQDNARKALEIRAKLPASRRGMTPVGIARARDLANGRPVSVATLERMIQYFARHEVDKTSKAWSSQDWSKGRQAWYGWGGDEGRKWAQDILQELDGQ